MRSSVVAIALGVISAAAAANIATGAGYVDPIPLNVAPGEVMTIFVAGVGESLAASVIAPAGKLPTELAGISVTVRQGRDYAAPILQVRPVSTCGDCGRLTAITIQIPYEVRPACVLGVPVCTVDFAQVITKLLVSENGTLGTAVVVTPRTDQIHFLNGCDNIFPNGIGLPCRPLVTHADGSLVTAAAPAHAGEELVAYAAGLGAVNPAAVTGEPPTAPAATIQTFTLDFNYRDNAQATPAVSGTVPAYAGVTPGYAGLYQINFVVPAAAGVAPCDGAKVQSNLTVSLVGLSSFDGVGICVSAAP